MAKAGENAILKGVRGHIGKSVVVKERHGQTIVTNMPDHDKKKRTEAMKKHARRFKRASKLAKYHMQDPEKLARYEAARKPGQSAYNVALGEFLNMIIAGKHEPTPTPPRALPVVHKLKTKNVTLLVDTDKDTIFQSAPDILYEHLECIINAAKKSTIEKVRKIVLRISCS
jgi:hypothetical protein